MSNKLHRKTKVNTKEQIKFEAERYEKHVEYIGALKRKYIWVGIILVIEAAILLLELNVWIELCLQLEVLVVLAVLGIKRIKNGRGQ